ncbi:hypothetical protein ADZ36_07120 [Streptomyces fradiae]|uniref:Uncharacterized protein n=1 Tax=Streptomyces fradiae TaxID=1906 RepID=A0ACC4WFI7_STRFR|nr:hypothetical protein ADZ36_07120 [Streptomyces fradiae]OFA48494.1 hypothetical protein BEN35_18715 [Streptomyces fradiae]
MDEPLVARRGSTAALACAALFLGSFGDEAAQVSFALSLAERSSLAVVSALLASGLVGAVAAGPCAPALMARFRPGPLIVMVFLVECGVTAGAGLFGAAAGYVLASFVLGFCGSLLWSAVLVLVPSLIAEGRVLARVNGAVQTVRNLGYVAGPALAGVLYAAVSAASTLWCISALLLLAAVVGGAALRRLSAGWGSPDPAERGGGRVALSLVGLLRLPGMARAIAPLVVTVLATSVLNVVLVLFVREELGYGADAYGAVVGALSVGLVLGPLLLTEWLGRFGEPTGAALSATVIGGALVGLGMGTGFWWLMGGALVAGLANGAQNTLMSTYLMRIVPADRRKQYVPAYVLIMQSCVLTGFLTAGLFQVRHSAVVLIGAGCVAGVAGVVGAFANRGLRAPMTVGKDG